MGASLGAKESLGIYDFKEFLGTSHRKKNKTKQKNWGRWKWSDSEHRLEPDIKLWEPSPTARPPELQALEEEARRNHGQFLDVRAEKEKRTDVIKEVEMGLE